MGFLKVIIKSLVYTSLVMLFLAYMPGLMDIQPVAYTVVYPKSLEDTLNINSRLNDGELLFKDKLSGPESLAVHNGKIYASSGGGWILELDGNKLRKVARTGEDCSPLEPHICGRPLGMRFDKKGTMYVADGFKGILSVDVKTGKVTTLLPITTVVDGKKLVFPDDLDMDDQGVIYFSDLSTKWPLNMVFYLLLEKRPTGRVLAFNPKDGEVKVIIDNLYAPNGIQITQDGNYLLVAEFQNNRILKYHLKGKSKGITEVFAKLPGEPDNIRITQRGTYWVALTAAYNSSNHHSLDCLSNLPLFRKIIARALDLVRSVSGYLLRHWSLQFLLDVHHLIGHGELYFATWPKHGAIMELDANGNVIQSLHSPDGKVMFFSEVLEHDGYLYVGSFINPFLLRLKAQQ